MISDGTRLERVVQATRIRTFSLQPQPTSNGLQATGACSAKWLFTDAEV